MPKYQITKIKWPKTEEKSKFYVKNGGGSSKKSKLAPPKILTWVRPETIDYKRQTLTPRNNKQINDVIHIDDVNTGKNITTSMIHQN